MLSSGAFSLLLLCRWLSYIHSSAHIRRKREKRGQRRRERMTNNVEKSCRRFQWIIFPRISFSDSSGERERERVPCNTAAVASLTRQPSRHEVRGCVPRNSSCVSMIGAAPCTGSCLKTEARNRSASSAANVTQRSKGGRRKLEDRGCCCASLLPTLKSVSLPSTRLDSSRSHVSRSSRDPAACDPLFERRAIDPLLHGIMKRQMLSLPLFPSSASSLDCLCC